MLADATTLIKVFFDLSILISLKAIRWGIFVGCLLLTGIMFDTCALENGRNIQTAKFKSHQTGNSLRHPDEPAHTVCSIEEK